MLFDERISDIRDNSFDDVIQAIGSILLVWVIRCVVERVNSIFNSFIKFIDVENEFRKVFNSRLGSFLNEWVNPYPIE